MNYRDILLADYFDEAFVATNSATGKREVWDPSKGRYVEVSGDNVEKIDAKHYTSGDARAFHSKTEVKRQYEDDLKHDTRARQDKKNAIAKTGVDAGKPIMSKKEIEVVKAAEKEAKADAKKKFLTKKNAAIAGGAAVGAAGAATATTSAVKLAKLKKNAKAMYAEYRSKGGKDSFEVWYKKKKAALIAGVAGGAVATGAGAAGAVLAKKKLQEAYDIAYIEAYFDEMQALEEAYESLNEDYEYDECDEFDEYDEF